MLGAWALVACLACERTTDVAGYVTSDEPSTTSTPVATSATPPTLPADLGMENEPTPLVVPPAMTEEPAGSTPSDAGAPSRVATLDAGGFFGRNRDGGAFGPFGDETGWPMGFQGPNGEGLWVSGWPIEGGSDIAVAWPLDVTLAEFFGPSNVESGYQVGVWVRGEQAQTLTEWWNSLDPNAASVSIYDEQRYVATEDAQGSVFAVSAEQPPDGTGFLFPIPDGT